MRKFFIIVGSIVVLLISSATFALQLKSIKDNQTVLVNISSKEESRCFVYHDRISVVRGLEGAYELKKDEKLGDIYIKPTPYFQHKAFSLFIATEEGHHYHVLVTPMDIPAQTIELKSLSPSHLIAARWERNSPYAQTLIHLISDMVNEVNPEGYAVSDIKNVAFKKLSNCLSLHLLTLYEGDRLRGEIWLVKNEGKFSRYVEPRFFYQHDVLAVSLQDEFLKAGEDTLLYRVVSNDP